MRLEFPDLEALVRAYLLTLAPTSVATPANLETKMPFIRITAGPGEDDGFNENALIDVECFAASRGQARQLAEDARTLMHGLGASAVNGKLVDSVETASRPIWVDYENPAVNRFVASYRLTLRRQPVA